MKRILCVLIIFCQSASAHFFENSVREDVTVDQAPFLIQVQVGAKSFAQVVFGSAAPEVVNAVADYLGDRPTCSAFFIENVRNKILVGSSRQCFFFKEQELLKHDDVIFRDFATGSRGHATRIVATDPVSDFFIVEVDFGDSASLVRSRMKSLRLAVLKNPQERPLRVFGFPADAERKSKPTLSRKCHLFENSDDTSKLYSQSLKTPSPAQRISLVDADNDNFKTKSEAILKQMTSLRHNCSVYAGNSGGPVVLEDEPNVLIGLPETYNPSPQIFKSDSYGLLESPARLIQTQKSILDTEGIVYEVRD